jgi:hypothetical protein
MRVRDDDAHGESRGEPRNAPPDRAVADDEAGAVAQLDRAEFARPAAALHRAVEKRPALRQSEHEIERVLCDRVGVCRARGRERDPAFRQRRHVNLVVAGPAAADDS